MTAYALCAVEIINLEIYKFCQWELLDISKIDFNCVSYAYLGRTIKDKIEKVERHSQVKIQYSINDFQVGQFVGCVYGQNWWMGRITGISRELQDITVWFMHPSGSAEEFQWPEECGKKKDECAVPLGNVLDPTPLGDLQDHAFDKAELIKIQQILLVPAAAMPSAQT
ncbi:hypothetical protein PR048_003840 [Dryococelus australis]|uniref:Uncharacterized protein n=1 Tax=Dryococelus australis TaxID=614101 RepID=A0ABQ9IQB3_9NEOP|nr:hypothetical protein PR048_003840 [Dryococelus australis]